EKNPLSARSPFRANQEDGKDRCGPFAIHRDHLGVAEAPTGGNPSRSLSTSHANRCHILPHGCVGRGDEKRQRDFQKQLLALARLVHTFAKLSSWLWNNMGTHMP